jgi:hypothetical protein
MPKNKRKVVAQSGSLTVSLPKHWCKKNSIYKNDILEIYISNINEVCIKPTKQTIPTEQAITETPCEEIPPLPECKEEVDVEKRVARMLALERGEL